MPNWLENFITDWFDRIWNFGVACFIVAVIYTLSLVDWGALIK